MVLNADPNIHVPPVLRWGQERSSLYPLDTTNWCVAASRGICWPRHALYVALALSSDRLFAMPSMHLTVHLLAIAAVGTSRCDTAKSFSIAAAAARETDIVTGIVHVCCDCRCLFVVDVAGLIIRGFFLLSSCMHANLDIETNRL